MRVICGAFRDFVRGNRYLNSDLLFVVFEICFRRDANKPNKEKNNTNSIDKSLEPSLLLKLIVAQRDD